MNRAHQQKGSRPISIRPEIPRADYSDEISDAAFDRLRRALEELNSKERKRTRISGHEFPIFY